MFALFACVLAASVSRKDFEEWQRRHGKAYTALAESNTRFRVFQENTERVEALRKANPLATFSLNRFADLTPHEFKSRFNGARGAAGVAKAARASDPSTPLMDVSAAPTSFDWRDKSGVLAPVQDQGQCGSCWAFSATCVMESRTAIASGKPVQKRAEQALVSCDRTCGSFRNVSDCQAGCSGGWPPIAFQFASKRGMPTEDSFPYTATNGTCAGYDAVAKFNGYLMVPQDETQLAAFTAATSPVSVCVDASNWAFYDSGIMTSSDICPPHDPAKYDEWLDHAVVVVGYGTENGVDYWIIRNSWADSWGEQGYCRIKRGSGYCGVQLAAAVPVPL